MLYVVRDGQVYRRVAAVEVSYEALSDEGKFMVDLWLKNSGKQPGTPEYEEYKKKAVQRALEVGETTDLTQRVNVASVRVAKTSQELLDTLAEAKLPAMEAGQNLKELAGHLRTIVNQVNSSVEWMARLAKQLSAEG